MDAAIPAGPLRVRSALLRIGLGVALFAIGVVGLGREWPWVTLPFYSWVWWAYILVVDGLALARRGRSLLSDRRALVLPMAFASVTFWFAFEALNLRFQNWYYVGCPRVTGLGDGLGIALFSFTAFATVFVGIFATADLLATLRLFEGLRGAPRTLPRWLAPGLQSLGAAMALAAVLSPTYLAPLVWGSVSLLLDPWNHRRGARSFLRDVERGDPAPILRMLLAGLICGVVWESLNFFAVQKWIYTVRGLEGLKLFEMPLLGFLGFPGLALDCFTVYALLSWAFFGNRVFEVPGDARDEPVAEPQRVRVFWNTAPLQLVFCALVASRMMTESVGSVSVRLQDLESLRPAETAALQELGVSSVRQLAAALEDPPRRAELERVLGPELRPLEDEVDLATFKGIGTFHSLFLRRVGVERVEQLREYEPEVLHARLAEAARELGAPPPRLDWVKAWVYGSRGRGLLQRAVASPAATP